MATFIWTPDNEPNEAYEPRTREAQFGDGYSQRLRFGLNNNPVTHTLEFTYRENTEANAILNFLNARSGVESFDWTPPWSGGVAGKFVCKQYKRVIYNCTYQNVSATFIQVFEP
jgi:phage-related protein